MGDDDQLFVAWREGVRAAGEELFERHYGAVARFFYNKVGDEGPDLIQRTFLACVEGRGRFRGECGFRSYLFSIAYKVLCKHYEQRRRDGQPVDPTTLSVADFSPTPSALLAARDEQRVLLAALRRLPLELQALLELHYWESLTAEAAAEVVGVSLGTAKTRIRRARQLLREHIAALGASPALVHSTLSDLQSWAHGIGGLIGRPT